jgi:WD40 repeat protein
MKRISLFLAVLYCLLTPRTGFAQEFKLPVLLWKLLPTAKVGDVAITPDNATVAVASEGKIFLWKIATGEELEPIRGDFESWVKPLVFSPDGKTLAFGLSDNTIRLWDMETKKERSKFEGHRGDILGLAFSHDGKTLASGSKDKTVKLWDLEKGSVSKTLEGFTFGASLLAFAKDDKTLVAAGGDDIEQRSYKSPWYLEVSNWDTQKGEQQQTLTISDFGLPATITPDGSVIAGWGKIPNSRTDPKSRKQAVRIYKVSDGEFSLPTYTGYPKTLLFAPDLKILAVAGGGGVDFWQGDARADRDESGRRGRDLKEAGSVISCAYAPNGKIFITVNSQAEVMIWKFP